MMLPVKCDDDIRQHFDEFLKLTSLRLASVYLLAFNKSTIMTKSRMSKMTSLYWTFVESKVTYLGVSICFQLVEHNSSDRF